MKKSGNLASFFIFGTLSQLVFLGLYALFISTSIPIEAFIVSPLLGGLFCFIRLAMDWKRFDNFFEDGIRRIFISGYLADQLLFSLIGALLVCFLNPVLFSVSPQRVFILSILAIIFSLHVHEFGRVQWNATKSSTNAKMSDNSQLTVQGR